MRFRPDKKYVVMGIIAFLVAACTILFVFAVFNYSVFANGLTNIIKVLLPVINGFLIAYLLNPIMKFFETKLIPGIFSLLKLKPPTGVRAKRNIRYISIALTVIFVLSVIISFIIIMIPQLIDSITSIAKAFPFYADNLVKLANKTFDDNPQVLEYFNHYYKQFEDSVGEIIKDIPSYVNQVWSTVSQGIAKSVSFVWNLVLGLILSVYILSFKEKFIAQMRKITLAYFNRKKANMIFDDIKDINFVFKNYIVSSIMDSVIIGILCFIGCLILQISYPILISFIIGITNIIPLFGPFIGAIPCTIITLMIDPIGAIYFIIMIFILQQLDGNLIKPKLFGNSTGLPAFWVIVSILIGGGLFGVAGMYLGTPVFAVIYSYIRRHVSKKLVAKGLPAETSKYVRSNELPYEIPEEERRDEEKVTSHIIEKLKDRIETKTSDEENKP